MKILVVDDQAEAAESLARSLHDLTGCETTAVAGLQAAMSAASEGVPDILVTEAVLEGGDGFNLREALREAQPDLLTVFVTEYDLSEYADYLDGAAVFYKPVDPKEIVDALSAPEPEPTAPIEVSSVPPPTPSLSTTDLLPDDQRSQSARLRKLVGREGFTGKLDQFDLVDIIQLCCISKRTGRLQIARRTERGVLYLRTGQIIHAVSGVLQGEQAAYEIVGWSSGQFSFDNGVQPEVQTIQNGWEHVIMEAVRRRDERNAAQADTPAGEDADAVNKSIGPYHLRRKVGHGERTEVFEAVQTSMDRVVALKVLSPEHQGSDEAVQHFLAGASAKANVQHPSILAVYEAGQHDGIYYYAREFVDGANLAHLHAEGRTIDDATTLQCIRVAAEALSYLNQQKIAHPAITAADLYLGRDGRARLNNLAALPDVRTPTTQHDIRALSRMVSDCLPNRTAASPGLRDLLGRMLLDGAVGFLSWGALLQGVKALEPKVVPEDAFRLSGREAAAQAAVVEAKRRQKRALVWTTLSMIIVFWIVAGAVYVTFFRASKAKNLDRMIAIPAGPFVYQKDERASTGAYWIDEYEVTIGQYKQFLDALARNPTKQYEAPNVPQSHHHDNSKWLQLYSVARSGGLYNNAPLDLNCPAVFVDWFDAYAYAKWKGHRLPTQQEWEKAARGPDGKRFPWGNDPEQVSKVNTARDYHEDGAAKGEVDGYNRWSPVDVMTGDKSVYGVMDMAGNVSEWTADVTKKGLLNYPAICGGNFGSLDGVETTRRALDVPDITVNERVGFRTVSDAAPPAAKQP